MSSRDRDAALERAWREASTEEPPSHLDSAIVAAARKASATRDGQSSELDRVRSRSMPWLARWQPFLAAAAVAGLALVLVPMLPREPAPAPSRQGVESTATPTEAPDRHIPPTTGDTAVTKPTAPPPPAEPMTGRRERAIPSPRRSAAETEVPAPAVASPPASPSTSAEEYVRERGATAGAAAPLGQAADSMPDVTTWIARIEALHAAGDLDAAARELRAFRAADPQADANLPDSLRDWARTVEPFPPDPGRE
jgi:hypothetical protein